MNWCVSPAGTCPLPGPLQFFLPCLWGMGNGSSPLTFTPAQKPPLPLSPYRRQRRGRGEGAGLPLGTAVAQSISPKLRNFLLPKRKKKRKKIPAATFPPCPIGTVKTGSVGFLGGWLRAGTLSGKSGGVPWQALRQAHFGLLPSPHFFPLQATHQRWPSPAPRPLGYRPSHWGPVGVTAQPWRGWAVGPWLPPYHILYPPSPELGISFHELLWGHLFPPQKSVPSSPTSPVEGGADPSTGRGEGIGPWILSLQGAAWEQGHRLLRSGCLCLKAQPLTIPPTASPSLALIWAPFSSLSLAFSSWRCCPSSQETVQGLHGCLAEGWIGRQGQEPLSSTGWGKVTPAC